MRKILAIFVFALLFVSTAHTAIIYGLEWTGFGTARHMLFWLSPPAIYDATYIFKVYPRKKTVASGTPTGYYTTFFWGNNGRFDWVSSNVANTYYGGHPYPVPAQLPNFGPGQWEVSTDSNDFLAGVEVTWDRWYTQVFIAKRESASLTHHQFYYDLPDTTKLVEHDINNSAWADTNPPTPAIVIGQAPNFNGKSWGGYDGWEEFNGIIRGIQIYSAALTIADAQLEITTPKSTGAGSASIWYLNVDPRPTDVLDKKASGSAHNPSWDGTAAAEWSEGSADPPPDPPQPSAHRSRRKIR